MFVWEQLHKKCSRYPEVNDVALTHWGPVTRICIGKLTVIGSDNGLSPGRRQAIFWTNAGILLFGLLGTIFSDILIWIQTFSLEKMHLIMASAKWRPFCVGLNVLKMQTNMCSGKGWSTVWYPAITLSHWVNGFFHVRIYVSQKLFSA